MSARYYGDLIRGALSRNPRLRPVQVHACDVLVGDILAQRDRVDTVVRMYPKELK